MGTLSLLFPMSYSFSSPVRLKNDSSSRTHLRKRSSWPNISSYTLNSAKIRGKTVVFGGNSSDPNESQFLDENGVVDDMDGYLNYLSLEYDSVWDTKPSWCQPWTIAVTGVSGIACSWLIFHSVVVTSVVLFLVCSWWYIFLYSYPKAYAEMIAERRKKVTSGSEDTYGWKKIQ
ncbi:uncharacterized protein LOC8259591 [Ricinus communis]|uniref:DUF6737 domain-containing protein n=1 Tax=Ricinus communis TaxID=3988 RepID=B9S406_RICCO|nr:uncharacterized protein LOC8259591 [Ricinus communis]XP_015575674.1 uncharacterized protein LOC8259591 [Ricinus communis]EEF41687.1 conserved hypothetical protein [Ricinus communis]|eukprot:XP_002520725.1 uncharacterized protein LOC8259591 [Ricinus communis]